MATANNLTPVVEPTLAELRTQLSALPVEEVEKRRELTDRIKSRMRKIYANVAERMRRSALALSNKKPQFAYYFGNIDKNEMASYRAMGFEIDRDKDVGSERPRNEDGSLVIGDAILLRMPIDEYEAIQELNHLKTEENLNAAVERLLSEAGRLNVPTFKVDKSQKEA